MTDQPVVNVILKMILSTLIKSGIFLINLKMKKKIGSKFYTLIIFKPWKINHKSPHKSLYRKYRRKN